MSLLGPSFQIGRSALAAYQAAIAISGQNIANLANPDYTRQSGRLEAQNGGPVLGGITPGAGVRLTRLQRHVDEALEGQLRLSVANRANAELTHRALSRVEAMYNELSDQDLSTQLSNMFGSFSALQTDPQSNSDRNVTVASADAAVRTIRRHRDGLLRQIEDLNGSVEVAARRAGGIADEIASLNALIVNQEARQQSVASPLRDRRDALLRELSELTGVEVRHQDNGSANVYLGGEPLVEFSRSRGLTVERSVIDGVERAVVRFADNRAPVTLREGQLAGIVISRDVHIREQLTQLDTLARGIIYEVNRVHSQGRGLVGYSNATGEYAVTDPAAALNTAAAGLTYPVQNGTFIVHVRDTATGTTITRQIEVDLDGLNGDDTSLQSLAASLGAVPGLSASVTSDNRLQLSAAAGSEFWFSEDSSGALAALGVGSFFTGVDAATIDVAAAVRSDSRLIAASATGQIADGENAGRLAQVWQAGSALLGRLSAEDYHAAMTNNLAVTTAAAQTSLEASDAVHSALYAQRESISGVSIDEEAINLTKFERAFQGATRYLGVLDNLSNEVLGLVR